MSMKRQGGTGQTAVVEHADGGSTVSQRPEDQVSGAHPAARSNGFRSRLRKRLR